LDFFVCTFYGTIVTIINDSRCFPKCPMLKIYFATFGGRDDRLAFFSKCKQIAVYVYEM
jgi:hypothetical protein